MPTLLAVRLAVIICQNSETADGIKPQTSRAHMYKHAQNLHRSDWQLCHFLSLLWSSLHIVVPECSNMQVKTAASDFWVMSAFIPFLEKCPFCLLKQTPSSCNFQISASLSVIGRILTSMMIETHMIQAILLSPRFLSQYYLPPLGGRYEGSYDKCKKQILQAVLKKRQ